MINDKGLKAQYIITSKPAGAPHVAARGSRDHLPGGARGGRAFLREWTKEAPGGELDEVPDMRDLVDWGYYTTRLASAIQKIISIPAALQHVPNPVPRVAHPDWLGKMVRDKDDKFKQRKLKDLFGALTAKDPNVRGTGDDDEPADARTPGKTPARRDLDMEDVGGGSLIGKTPGTGPRVRRFFRGVEDQAPGGGDDASPGGAPPATPEGEAARRVPRTGPSPEEGAIRRRSGPRSGGARDGGARGDGRRAR